jgi:hypothetical protein
MKIVVIGGSGLIGKKLIPLLRRASHEAVSASPSSGVNTLTGEGLAEALAGADVVVDVTNSPSFEDKAVLEFFEKSTRNILAAEAAASVKHHVALSVVGADRFPDSGYMRAKFSPVDHPAVFSCYRPVPDDTPVPPQQRALSEDDWARLYGLARANKRKAFETYAGYYLSTSGQVYWSDTHQLSGGIDYYTQVAERQRGIMPLNTEMIVEVYVSWENLIPFLAAARSDFVAHQVDVTYGTIRFVERDEDTFLAWAKERQVCILCNLNIVHTPEGRQKAVDDVRRLIDCVVHFGGRYFLTYQRWATRPQVEACYPQFVDFLRLKN